MQAIILTGGMGIRLQRLYPNLPKSLVPICGKPFIEWQIEWLVQNGLANIHLATGYMGSQIEEWCHRRKPAGLNITLSLEPMPLGTAGGLKFIELFVRSDPFFVLNGDSLMPKLNFIAMQQAHRRNRFVTTIAVTRIQEAGRYGAVNFDKDRRLTFFREKTDRLEGWINGGVYLISQKILEHIEPAKNLSLETDIFPALTQKKLIYAFPSDPPLLDMGTPEGLVETREYLSANRNE